MLGLGVAVTGPTAFGAAPSPSAAAFLGVSGGHDDNILGRISSAAGGPDTTLSSAFGQLRPSLEARLVWHTLALEAGYSLAWNGFQNDAAGHDLDQNVSAAAHWQPLWRLELGAAGRAERFRRSRFDDYDLDHRGGGAWVRVQPLNRIRFRGAIDLSRDEYPKSRIPIGLPALRRTAVQLDEPSVYAVETDVWVVSHLRVRVGGSLISTSSSIVRYEYDGRQLLAGVAWFAGGGLSLWLDWAHESRDYDAFAAPAPGVDPLTCLRPNSGCDHREDRSDSYSLEARRALGSRLVLEASWSRIDYRSNLDDFSFDQTRVRLGAEISLGRVGRDEPIGSPPPALTGIAPLRPADGLAPQATDAGVRFRCRAPGAGSVTLVGSFNDWNREADPLSDADGDGTWELTLALPSGMHRYMFLVDGHDWIRPEEAVMYEDDGFGLANGIVFVP